MIIGILKYDSEHRYFHGSIVTVGLEIHGVYFTPTKKSGDKEPDYRVLHEVSGAREVELGAAWKRKSDKGQEFLSVSLDGPMLKTPFNCALFHNKERDDATLVWTRPKAKADKAA